MALKDDYINILVVDDSELVLTFALRVLKDSNVTISTAENGRLALEYISKHPVDILVTDLVMPEMDGFELISRIRRDDRFQQIHIIVMTALDQIRDKIKALELGANDYTVKPLDAGEFRARVQAGRREIMLKRKLTAALDGLDHELQMVGRLQQRLLPKALLQNDLFHTAVFYRPCRLAGGDYYDCFYDARGRTIFTTADVSGHGASAAVLMGMFRALLKLLVEKGDTAASVMERLNKALLDNIGDDPDFISVFLGIMEPGSHRFNYCSAGHGDMLLLGPEKGAIKRLSAGGTVLGCFQSSWNDEYLDIQPNQTLVLYTDGLIECLNDSDEEFGRNRLEELLLHIEPGRNPTLLVETIRAKVEKFANGTAFSDDVTLFIIKFN